jgi:lipoprotein-releasing system ATP-binding protein
LESKATRSANKLSGGEQQRVAIARAIVNSPSLILADEPTGNLDSENSHKVFDLLQELAERDNLGVLIVTHNTELALKTDNLIRMQDGLIVKD